MLFGLVQPCWGGVILREPPKDLLPPLPKLVKQRDYVRPVVIGCMAVIALVVSFVGVRAVRGVESFQGAT